MIPPLFFIYYIRYKVFNSFFNKSLLKTLRMVKHAVIQ